MRKAVAGIGLGLVTALSLSGCGIPITVAIAGYAVSGFTLIDQGKLASDVVLSAALDEDCMLWRLVQDQPVCIDPLDEGVEFVENEETQNGQIADLTGKAPKLAPSN